MAEETDVFTFDVDPAQTLTIATTPASALQPHVELHDPSGVLIGSAAASGPGRAVILQAVPASTGGSYVLSITGLGSTVGTYSTEVLLNAAVEAEPYTSTRNDDVGGAQDIEGDFLTFAGDGERAAVVGTLETGKDTTVVEEDFESGAFGAAWTTYNAGSAMYVGSDKGAAGGTYALIMRNPNPNIGRVLTEAVWTVDLSATDEAVLTFAYASTEDGGYSFYAGDFEGHFQADGVAISDDGLHWHPVWETPSDNSGTWNVFNVDLAATAAAADMELTSSFRIKFQAYDIVSSTRFRGWDDIKVVIPGAADTYAFELDAGETASAGLTAFDASPVDVELLDASGIVLAAGSDAAARFDKTITDFTAPATGTYYARVIGARATDYSLVVNRGAQLSLGPHDDADSAQDITSTGVVLGTVGLTMGRLFTHNTYAGHNDILEINPQTGGIVNQFTPAIGNISGMAVTGTTLLVASQADGRIYEMDPDDGSILRSLSVPGQTLLGLAFWGHEIFVRTGAGFIALDYSTGNPTNMIQTTVRSGPSAVPEGLLYYDTRDRVVLLDPVTGQVTPLGYARVSANNPYAVGVVNAELFVTNDFYEISVLDLATLAWKRGFTVPHSSGGVRLGDMGADVSFGEDWYRFSVNAGDDLVLRTYTPAGGPDEFSNAVDPAIELYDPSGTLLVSDDDGAPDERNAQLTYHAGTTGIYLVHVGAANIGGEYVLHVDGFTGADTSSFVVSDIDLEDGAVLGEVPARIKLTFSEGIRLDTLGASDVKVDGVSAAGLLLVDGRTVFVYLPSLTAGTHQVTIAAGAITGVGGTGIEAYSSSFTVASAFSPVNPLGSLIYEQSFDGSITVPGGLALYSLELDAGQTLTVVVHPETGLQPTIEMRDPSGTVLGVASASAPGMDALLQTVRIDVPGTYRISFGGAAGTTGDFTVHILINAATEAEEHDGPTNDDLASAEDLDAAFIDLGEGASRAAVTGELVYYANDFEDGLLGPGWVKDVSYNTSRLRVTDEYAVLGEGFAMVLDSRLYQWGAKPAAIWTVDLSRVENPWLSFRFADLGSNGSTGDGPNGAQISQDGTNWFPIFTAPNLVNWTWQSYSIDLAAQAAAAGIDLAQPFEIRFRQYAAKPADPTKGGNSQGAAYDDILISSTNAMDFHRFTLEAGEVTDLVATNLNGRGIIHLELYDETGRLALATAGSANVDVAINRFVAPVAGTYYAKVFDCPGRYSLVLTRNAALETDSLQDPAEAVDLTRVGRVLGEVSSLMPVLVVSGYDGTNEGFWAVDLATGQMLSQGFLFNRGYAGVATTASTLLVGARWKDATVEYSLDAFQVVRSLPNPGVNIEGMAYINNEVFITHQSISGQIIVVDYQTGAVKRRINTVENLRGLDADWHNLYGAAGETIYRIDSLTGDATPIGTIPGLCPGGLGVIGDELFVYTNASGMGYATKADLDVYDLTTLTKKQTLGRFGPPRAIGTSAREIYDLYAIQAASGDTLDLATSTPAGGPGLFVNEVDPRLEFYDASGVMVASDDDGADGRNAHITWAAATTGTYIVRVLAKAGTAGEYVLHASGSTAAAGQPFAVERTDPAHGSVHETRPTQLEMVFSDLILLKTLEASDLTVDGVTATGLTLVDGRTVIFDLPAFLAGTHTIEIAQGAIRDVQGTPIDAFSMQIVVGEYEFPVPLTAVEPLGSLVYRGSVDGRIDPEGDTNSYTLDLEAGQKLTAIARRTSGDLEPTIALYDPSGTLVRVAQPGSSGEMSLMQYVDIGHAGTWTLAAGGDASTVGDFELQVLLNALGEEEDFSGIANDVMGQAEDIDPAFQPLASTGELAAVVGSLNGDEDWYRLSIGALQNATLALTSLQGAAPEVELYDGAGTLLATGQSGKLNVDRVIEDFSSVSGDTYFVRISGPSGGEHSLFAMRGATFDLEDNDGQAAAQNLAGTGVALGYVFHGADAITQESEPNNNVATADDLSASFAPTGTNTYKVTVNGSVYQGDSDFYRFLASPGDRLSIDHKGISNFNANIYNRKGKQIALDPYFYDRFSYAGEYYIGAYYWGTSTSSYWVRLQLTTNHLLGQRNDDWYSISVNDGDVMIFSTATPGDGEGEFVNALDPMLELYDPSGALVAFDDNGGADGRNALLRYAARETGAYAVRVSGNTFSDGEYVLSVDVTDPATVPMWMVSVAPADGATVTEHPDQVFVEFSHRVDETTLSADDLTISGVAATGFSLVGPYTVAFDTPGTLEEGAYVVEMSADALDNIHGSGSEAFASGFDFDPPSLVVLSVNPTNDTVLYEMPTQVTLDFSQPVLDSTLDASDLLIGGLPAADVTLLDVYTVIFDVPAGVAEGNVDLMLADDVLGDIYGQGNESFSSRLIYSRAPRVISSSIVEGEVLSPGSLTYVAVFDKPMATADLTQFDFELVVRGTKYITSLFNYDSSTSTLTLTYPNWTEGSATLTLKSGPKALRSTRGWDLDGEPNPGSPDNTPSGDGLPGGDFVVHFNLDVSTSPLPTLQDLPPADSGVKEATFGGFINEPGDVDRYCVDLQAGQTVTVATSPNAGLQMVVDVLDDTGTTIGSISGAAAGEELLLQTVRVTRSGLHTIRFTPVGSGVGTWSVRALMNAAVEEELYGLSSNDTPADAQDLAPGTIVLPGGERQSNVVGSTPTGYGVVVMGEDFESGVLGPAWSLWSSDPRGRVRLRPSIGRGAWSLLMDRDPSGGVGTLNEAIWTVDLSGLTRVNLHFRHRSYRDESDLFDGDFVEHYNADGVAISDDGVNWHPVADVGSDRWGFYVVDLAAEAAAAGMTLGPDFRIKFQQYDDSSLSGHRRGYDDIVIAVPDVPEDWYALTLQRGERLTLQLAELTGTGTTLALYDETGSLLAEGAPGSGDVAQVIADFRAAETGSYHVRIGGAGTAYSLVARIAARPVLELVGGYDTAGDAKNVDVVGDRAYVADYAEGLVILDVSDPASPVLLGRYDTPGRACSVKVVGSLAFVADGWMGLQIIDVSNPNAPGLVGTCPTPGIAWGVDVAGTLAFVADDGLGLLIIDVSDPSSPTIVGGLPARGSTWSVRVAGTLAFLAEYGRGLRIVDVSDPASPMELGRWDSPGTALSVDVRGTLVALADVGGGVRLIDVSDPSVPIPIGHYASPAAYGVRLDGDWLYVADHTLGLVMLDVDTPQAPVLKAVLDTPGNACGLAGAGAHVFVASRGAGVQVVRSGLVPVLDLLPSSDTGIPDDNVTTDVTPTFAVLGVGGYVRLYRDGVPIGTGYETSPVTLDAQPYGTFTYTAAFIDASGRTGVMSAPLQVTLVDPAGGVPLVGDANGDGLVNGVDLSVWQQNYDPSALNENSVAMGDWNGDTKIDGGDLALWQQNYAPLGPGGASAPAGTSDEAVIALERQAVLPLENDELAIANEPAEEDDLGSIPPTTSMDSTVIDLVGEPAQPAGPRASSPSTGGTSNASPYKTDDMIDILELAVLETPLQV